jgi:phage recombination protein Bet
MKPTNTLNEQDSELLRRTVTAQLSDDEHALFIRACQRSGLDPFARQIYFIRESNRLLIEATIDGMRLAAERTGSYAGQIGPHWCGPDGKWKRIWTEAEPPTGARVGILRKEFAKPIWGKALFAEFDQQTEFWQRMPANQIAKCAEALAFRKAFPNQFSGLYTPEELPGKPILVSSEPARRAPSVAAGLPDRGDAPRSIPPALQPFVAAGFGDRSNVQAAFGFLQGELAAAHGDAGTRMFREIYMRLPRIFKTREECRAATLGCWLEMWEAAIQRQEAA